MNDCAYVELPICTRNHHAKSCAQSSTETYKLNSVMELCIENICIDLVFETVSNKICIIVFDKHIELSNDAFEKVEYIAFIHQFLSAKNNLIWAFALYFIGSSGNRVGDFGNFRALEACM